MQLQEGGVQGSKGTEPKGTRLPRAHHPPHAEIQREAQVSGDLQDMVWGQPDLGLGIEESEEIEAGWSDACNRGERGSGGSICCQLLCGPPHLMFPITGPPSLGLLLPTEDNAIW